MQNDGNINVRDEMRRNPQGVVNLPRRMFGVYLLLIPPSDAEDESSAES